MKGEMVVIRDHNGRALRRRVWDYNGSVVFVTDNETFDKLSVGQSEVWPIGFQLSDVFECDEGFTGGEVDWSKLKQWIPRATAS